LLYLNAHLADVRNAELRQQADRHRLAPEAAKRPAWVAFRSAMQNKERMQQIFAALSEGDSKPFVDALADDIRWTITGSSSWSRTWNGKDAVQRQLLAPLFAQFADRYTAEPSRFIAEDDYVVVEYRGRVTTKTGRPYNNAYCYVFRLADGEVKEITEYFDTLLAEAALEPPPK
jgi:ketosteroid isomerase-like protein